MFRIRLVWTLVATLVLLALIAWLAPQQLPVTAYKLSLLTLAALAGYWIDRELFPYARPDSLMVPLEAVDDDDDVADASAGCTLPVEHHGIDFAAAMLRRAIIVAAAMIAVGLGA